MKPELCHGWDLSVTQALELQQSMRQSVRIEPLSRRITRIAGIDVGFREEHARAAITVIDYPSLTVVETAIAKVEVTFPYIPGLLSFREIPVIISAMEKLHTIPDLFVVDGQGIAHPRRFGLASHLGVLFNTPSIGCAKSRLVGEHTIPGELSGSTVPLIDNGEVIGTVLRSRTGCKPLYISIGHLIDLISSVSLIRSCLRGYRLPEPTRLAHKIASNVS